MKTTERTTDENVDGKVAARRSGRVARKVNGDLRAPSVREVGEGARRSPPTSGMECGAMAGSAPVWIGVGIVFALLAMAWTALFFYASKHRAADVPLEHRKTEGTR